MQANRSNSRAQASNAERAANAQAAQRRAEMQQAAEQARVALARSLERQADREAAQSAATNSDAGTSTRAAKTLRTTSKQPDFLTTDDSTGFVDELPAEDSINAEFAGDRPNLEDREEISGGNLEISSNEGAGTNDGDIYRLSQSGANKGEVISFYSGNDAAIVQKGSLPFIIDGGTGRDQVLFEGSRSDYTFEYGATENSWLVTEKRAGVTHSLNEVEQVSFGSAPVDPDAQEGQSPTYETLSYDGSSAALVGSSLGDVIYNGSPGTEVFGGDGNDVYIAKDAVSGVDSASLSASTVDLGSGGNQAFISSSASAQTIRVGEESGYAIVYFEGSRGDYDISVDSNGTTRFVKDIHTGVIHTLEGNTAFDFQDSATIEQTGFKAIGLADGATMISLQQPGRLLQPGSTSPTGAENFPSSDSEIDEDSDLESLSREELESAIAVLEEELGEHEAELEDYTFQISLYQEELQEPGVTEVRAEALRYQIGNLQSEVRSIMNDIRDTTRKLDAHKDALDSLSDSGSDLDTSSSDDESVADYAGEPADVNGGTVVEDDTIGQSLIEDTIAAAEEAGDVAGLAMWGEILSLLALPDYIGDYKPMMMKDNPKWHGPSS